VALPVTVPRLGWSMDEGTFVEWLKRDGDLIRPGDSLFVLEGEKAAENIEAIDQGLLRLTGDSPKPGDLVKVGQVIAYLAAAGEATPGGHVTEKAAAAPAPGTALIGAEHAPAPPASPPSPTRRGPAASPRARRAAGELGIDWQAVPGSGRGGRIRERDIRAAASTPQGRLIPHTNIRRTIAARLVAGVTEAAPVTLTTRADATNLVNLRGQFQAAAASPNDLVPSYTDLIVKLAAAALREHPLLQAQWREDGLFMPERVDIAVAVDTEAGLLVPVIRGADRLSLREVAARARELLAQARAGRLTAADMRDATFTVTNLGMFGIDAFTPILHLPQSAILGVGRIAPEPAVVADRVVPRETVTLSLTFDHRVVDGAPAARFLDTLRRCLEHPAPWLLP
jgi:pyruvate dehydrogenase E2 component (dihydrolipoamide acetyltransferase)